MVEIWAVGGYSEIGRNMTGIRSNNEVLICDMGASMDKIVALEEKGIEEPIRLSAKELVAAGALPNDTEFYDKWGKLVKAIVVTHAHLDHLWGTIKLAEKYNCPLIMTPFTAEVLANIVKNERLHFKNKVIKLNPGMTLKISDNFKIEFIYATHSTPQTAIIAVHTIEGTVIYANDWKFDEYPTIGKRTDYDRLSELGKKGVLALLSDSTRIEEEKRTFSESLVKEMFKDILFWTENQENAVIVATFASHVARINMLVNMANEMHRKPILLGRSMLNYVSAAERIGLVNITKHAKIFAYKQKIAKILHDVQKNRKKYFIICTGCQGEPNSVLTRIAKEQFKFDFTTEDQVIFSSNIIPSEVNITHRAELERILKQKKVRIFNDVHVSGHASKEDMRDMLNILKPKHYIPSHGDIKKLAAAVELGREMDYVLGKTVHLLQNGYRLVIE